MSIKIDKRVPMGFCGIWARCYKMSNANQTQSSITYQAVNYYDVGFDVQIKLLDFDKTVDNSQPIENLITKNEYRKAQTTDAYFNGNDYECIIQPNDIIYFEGNYWVCDKVEEKGVYTPQKQGFYYIGLKKIFEDIIVDNFSQTCIVQVTPEDNGSVTLTPLKEFYVKGETVLVTITPDEGYKVDTISGVSLDANNKFTVTGDTLIDVTFEEE